MIQANLSIPFEAVDALDEYLLEAGAGRWMVSQDVLARTAVLIGVFDSKEDARKSWAEISAENALLAGLKEPEFQELRDQDWKNSYKAHFKAWQFGRLHWVPVWEKETYSIPNGDAAIWLDPGLAFGTGNHETTRLCCERLVALAQTSSLDVPVLDAGCGSGILALSAARLGFKKVAAFDNDPEAVRVSVENAAMNGLDQRINFFVGDLTTGIPAEGAGVLLANIQADVLMRFCRELLTGVAPRGALVLSGILSREIKEVENVFRAAAPDWWFDTRTLGEWSDVLLVRP